VRPAAGLLLLALIFGGCESNQEKSAKLEKLAHHQRHVQSGLSITRPSAYVHVLRTTLLAGSEGAAAVVTLRNISARPLGDLPIAITVKSASSGTLYQNNTPGLEAGLTSLASLPAHAEATWVDDQLPASSGPAAVSARVGEAREPVSALPQIEVRGVHASEESATGGAGIAGIVRNRSNITQQNLVVYGLGRQGARIVAAGRAVLPEVAAGASVPFQAFLVGSPQGAKLEASAPPTTFG
jgi:hypothetical protein